MLFNPETIGKMKMAELEDAIKVYEDNIEEVQVVELSNNNERASFLTSLVEEYGVPIQVTEEIAATNEFSEEDVEVGGYVFVPADYTPESEVREKMMEQVAELTADHGDERKAAALAKAETLSTEELAAYVNELIENQPQNDADDEEDEEDDKDAAEGNSDASEDGSKEPPVDEEDEEEITDVIAGEDGLDTEAIQNAIHEGKLRFEGKLITGFRPKPLSGVIMFELFGSDNATYLANRDQLKSALGLGAKAETEE